mgnify:CR=1 FL=1
MPSVSNRFLIAVIIAISTLGTALIYTLSAPRIYFAMAEDGLFFKKIAEEALSFFYFFIFTNIHFLFIF